MAESEEDKKFKKTVDRLLKTPPKPHKPANGKAGKKPKRNQGDDKPAER